MTILDFSIKLGADPDDLFRLLTDFRNLPTFLPDQLKNVEILEEGNSKIVTKETLVFSSFIKKTIIQKTEHRILADNNLQSRILSGPAKDSVINILMEKDDGDALITIVIQLKLDLKARIFLPIIKKMYKSILTGIFYKMNTDIMN